MIHVGDMVTVADFEEYENDEGKRLARYLGDVACTVEEITDDGHAVVTTPRGVRVQLRLTPEQLRDDGTPAPALASPLVPPDPSTVTEVRLS